MFRLELSHSSYEPHMKEKSRSSYRFYLSKVDTRVHKKIIVYLQLQLLYIGSYPPGARYMYLNFLRVDSKNGN